MLTIRYLSNTRFTQKTGHGIKTFLCPPEAFAERNPGFGVFQINLYQMQKVSVFDTSSVNLPLSLDKEVRIQTKRIQIHFVFFNQ
jgi:hypothetical protein